MVDSDGDAAAAGSCDEFGGFFDGFGAAGRGWRVFAARDSRTAAGAVDGGACFAECDGDAASGAAGGSGDERDFVLRALSFGDLVIRVLQCAESLNSTRRSSSRNCSLAVLRSGDRQAQDFADSYVSSLLRLDWWRWRSSHFVNSPMRTVCSMGTLLTATVTVSIGPADSCDPLVALKLFEAERDGFEERRGGDFDGVGDAFHVGNGDATGADFHGGRVSYSLFVRHGVYETRKASPLKR